MKIFNIQFFLLLLPCACMISSALKYSSKKPQSTIERRSTLGPLQVNRGQVTFDSEGNDYPNSRYFSRKPHVPSSNSGVTLGRGYDLKEKKSSKVLSDLRSVGIDFKIAKTFSRAVGLKGLNAKNFIKRNKLQDFTITHQQQKDLFYIAYDEIAADAQRLATKADVERKYGKTNWNGLNRAIKEIVIDLRYRGDYTPTTRRKIQRAIARNDLREFTKLLSDRYYWRNVIGVPEDRFIRRKNVLVKAG